MQKTRRTWSVSSANSVVYSRQNCKESNGFGFDRIKWQVSAVGDGRKREMPFFITPFWHFIMVCSVQLSQSKRETSIVPNKFTYRQSIDQSYSVRRDKYVSFQKPKALSFCFPLRTESKNSKTTGRRPH